jgi:hypothetical protein
MRRKSLWEWKQQLSYDKFLYLQAKKHKKMLQRAGLPLDATARMVGHYGKLYRESLAGYRRALKRYRR